MWPVIIRELRVGARRWTTYWLRLLGAGAVVAGVIAYLLDGLSSPTAGGEVFAFIHRILLAAIWILVPLMTCDCLSSEKREGTLGLLFLTNLRPWEIVIAKMAAQGLRALTLWLATVPIIAVPLLIGGLGWPEILLSCSLTFASICGALAVGLFASVLNPRFNGAVAWVVVLVPAFLLALFMMMPLYMAACVTCFGQAGLSRFLNSNRLSTFILETILNLGGAWESLFQRPEMGHALLLDMLLLVPLAGLALLGCCFLLIAPILRNTWQDKPKTKRRIELEQFFCSPVLLTGLFKRWMRRAIEKNPIGWLEKRSWQGRLTSWVWLAIMTSFASALAYSRASQGDLEGFNVLMVLLLATMAYLAASSFRRERETGALELILVTPLSERQIIWGRLRGLWSQFLPTVLLWAAVVIYLSSAVREWGWGDLVEMVTLYLSIPIVGLYFSLRTRLVLLAWLATASVCGVLPPLTWLLLNWLGETVLDWHHSHQEDSSFCIGTAVMLLTILGLAWLCWHRLRQNLLHRKFVLR